MQNKKLKKRKIHLRIRNKISGTAAKPRLCVFRSNKGIYAQCIDDIAGVTLASASSKNITAGGSKIEIAKAVGSSIGEKIKSQGIDEVVFDRGGNLYHGRVKALAEGARESGLNF